MESRQLDQNLEGNILFESVAGKAKKIIERFSPVGTAAVLFSETFKTVGKAVPFAYKPAKQLQELLAADLLKPHGYEYKPEEITYTAFRILEKNGELTREEEEFVRENYVAIKRLILHRSKERKEQANQKNGGRVEMIYGAVKNLVRTVLKRGEEPKKREKEKPATTPDAMGEFDLLGMDVFDLAELERTDPGKFYGIFSSSGSYRTPTARAEHYRRIFGIDKDVTDEMIEEAFAGTQAEFLERINTLWEQILKMFHQKEENIERGKFKGKVKDAKSIFELYEILNGLESRANLSRKDLEELDQARVKLALDLRASKIRLSPQYRLRHSIKAYMDKYLVGNVFESMRKIKIPVPTSSQIDAGKMASLEVEIWAAELLDPDSDETIPVYLYVGGDSEHPEEKKSGIINLKSMAKAVLKSFATRKEPDDLFRMTVMPRTERPEDLERVRNTLAKTLLHPQSITEDGQKNHASTYSSRDVRSVVTTVVPSVTVNGKLLRGFIRDVKNKNRPTRISSFKIEVRTGPTREVVSEHHPFDDSNHGVYRMIRMLPVFNSLRDPRRYPENWKGRAVQIFDSMEEEIEETTTDTLPLWVRHKFMETYLSALGKKPSTSSRLSPT